KTVLAVAAEELMVRRQKFFGVQQQRWSRRQLADIRVGCIHDSDGPDTPELQIQPHPGEGTRFRLPLRDEAEARWLATLLRRALRMPEENPPDQTCPFLERQVQPAGSRIIQDISEGKLTLAIPPAGFANSSVRYLLLCSLLALSGGALLGFVILPLLEA